MYIIYCSCLDVAMTIYAVLLNVFSFTCKYCETCTYNHLCKERTPEFRDWCLF